MHKHKFQSPRVIAHRGASGELPEHTLEAYQRAIDQGADYIELDLVMTKDGVLISRHENELSETTDVAQKFPKFKKTKTIDGQEVEGWFSEDLTLAQIKTLGATQRLSFRPQEFNGKYQVATFAEVLALAKKQAREVGVYPEIKHSTYFTSIGLPLEVQVVKDLEAVGWNTATAPVVIQSFEVANLKKLKTITPVALVQLFGGPDEQPYDIAANGDELTYQDMMSKDGLEEIATYAFGIGPWKNLVWPVKVSGELDAPSPLVERAHAQGLKVHAYTFRNENKYLPSDYKGAPEQEYGAFYKLGIDGVFTDFPETAVRSRKKFVSEQL